MPVSQFSLCIMFNNEQIFQPVNTNSEGILTVQQVLEHIHRELYPHEDLPALERWPGQLLFEGRTLTGDKVIDNRLARYIYLSTVQGKEIASTKVQEIITTLKTADETAPEFDRAMRQAVAYPEHHEAILKILLYRNSEMIIRSWCDELQKTAENNIYRSSDPRYPYQLGMALEMVGDYKGAKKAFIDAIKKIRLHSIILKHDTLIIAALLYKIAGCDWLLKENVDSDEDQDSVNFRDYISSISERSQVKIHYKPDPHAGVSESILKLLETIKLTPHLIQALIANGMKIELLLRLAPLLTRDNFVVLFDEYLSQKSDILVSHKPQLLAELMRREQQDDDKVVPAVIYQQEWQKRIELVSGIQKTQSSSPAPNKAEVQHPSRQELLESASPMIQLELARELLELLLRTKYASAVPGRSSLCWASSWPLRASTSSASTSSAAEPSVKPDVPGCVMS